MDRLADGSHALIDYKTGASSRRSSGGRAADEPQAAAVRDDGGRGCLGGGLRQVPRGQMRFIGYARDKEALPA
jgi:hypothetical protein